MPSTECYLKVLFFTGYFQFSLLHVHMKLLVNFTLLFYLQLLANSSFYLLQTDCVAHVSTISYADIQFSQLHVHMRLLVQFTLLFCLQSHANSKFYSYTVIQLTWLHKHMKLLVQFTPQVSIVILMVLSMYKQFLVLIFSSLSCICF